MITQKEILRLARERDACEQGLAWYEERPKSALLTWDAIENKYFMWVARNIPEAIPYLQTLPEELKDKSLISQEVYVRESMAIIRYRLKVLKDDPCRIVRCEVAQQGYALEQLKDDPCWLVRHEVAHKGYALEQLKNDQNWCVRAEVAKQGYALEQLKDDPDEWVRFVAEDKLKEMKQ